MRNKLNRLIILIVVISITIVGVTLTLYSYAQNRNQIQENQSLNQSKKEDDEATPIVDIDRPQPMNNDRIEKNRRHNKVRVVALNINSNATEFMWNNPLGQLMPDFPIVDSDIIVEGEVIDSAAYLSEDRGTVYSEFTFQVTNILKTVPNPNIIPQDFITLERYGGRVRYPNGRIIRYGVSGQGSPAKGKRYLLFLEKTELNYYRILVGYELRGNRVFSLNGSHLLTHGRKGYWNTDKHNNQDIQAFMEEFEKAKINPPDSYKNRSVGP